MEKIQEKELIMYPEKWEEGKPVVSIVAICHNHAPYVIETLESIRQQTYPNIELIVINNLKDECEQLINDWILSTKVRCIFLQNTEPYNVSKNCNSGLSLLNGEFVQLISCDDVLLNDKISYQTNILEKNRNIAVAHGDSQEIDEKGNFLNIVSQNLKQDVAQNLFAKIFCDGLTINTPTALMRRKCIVESGGYNEQFEVEDFPMWLHLSKKWDFFYSKKVFVMRRVLKSSLSRSIPNFKYSRENAIKLHADHYLYNKAIRNQQLQKVLREARYGELSKSYKSLVSNIKLIFHIKFLKAVAWLFYRSFLQILGKNTTQLK